MTNAVVYYSNTNQSKRAAQYFADILNYPAFDIFERLDTRFDNLILVFPIHCQGLPTKVQSFLKEIKASNITLIATYGKMCHGNALYEAQHKFNLNVVAAAYIPAKHSYLNCDSEFDSFEKLEPIVQKILNPSSIQIPRSYKNPFADFFKKKRSQIGVKINKNEKCNRCGACTQACRNNAINNGIVNKNCIRCLKCVMACPVSALHCTLSVPMKLYLKRKKHDDLIVYI